MAEQKVLGMCPCCGSNIVESPKAYGCENQDCKARIWKENKYFEAIGLKITEAQATELFENGKVWVEGLRSKKTGNSFDAFITAEFSGDAYPQFGMEFKERESAGPAKVIGVCPCCMSNLVESPKAYGCENQDCKVRIWKNDKFFESIGFPVTEENAVELITNGKIRSDSLVSKKSGKSFAATINATFSSDERPQYNLEFDN